MSTRTIFKQIGMHLTKLWNPNKYYYTKYQEMSKEKFKLFETIKTSKNISDAVFRDSTKERLKNLDNKFDDYSNKWNATKTRTFSKQRKNLTTQKNTLIELDLAFHSLFHSLESSKLLSPPNSDKKQEISEYMNSVFISITKHIILIDEQLSLEKRQINQDMDNPVSSIAKIEQTMLKDTQQKNKGLDSPGMKKHIKDILKNKTAIYNEKSKNPENVQMLKNLKNVKISSAEKSR